MTLVILSCQTLDIPKLPAESTPRAPVSFAQVKPILSARCVACHSCMESPCQLNMQTWDGLRRGAFHQNVYDGSRLNAVPTTRLFEDAQTESQWRDKGFFDVMNGGDNSLFTSTLRLSNRLVERPFVEVRNSEICPASQKQLKKLTHEANQLGMPYALPALPIEQQELLADWVKDGAKGEPSDSSLRNISAPLLKQVHQWQAMLNAQDLKSRIVGRYLYEHLFLSHLYTKESPREFLKLVRSSTACENGVTLIATRRPNENPGVKKWYYCFVREVGEIAFKNHLPYELSDERLLWMKTNFFLAREWTPKAYPSFDYAVAGNPLVAYADIPVIARYRFLLENAQYEVMTFIKGPVCNGSFAVNAIQEQFYVFFVNPNSDLMVRSKAFAQMIAPEALLPGTMGSDLNLPKIITGYNSILDEREKARQQIGRQIEKVYPNGVSVKDIWDGDGTNDNAVLTVFRHGDNAKVLKGARGDTPKTAFVLDYSTFERLVYNLVINFDVFDNVSHQLLTRLYMDILRMDAEDTFLTFLPPNERVRLKNEWYQGFLTQLKINLINEDRFPKIPSGTKFASDDPDIKNQFIRDILFKRMNEKVRGPVDEINWKHLRETLTSDKTKLELKRIAAIRADETSSPFPKFFPELSFLFVRDGDNETRIFSILRNREHQNVSWIGNEEARLQSNEDTLTILSGQAGAYPNQYFTVDKAQLPKMIDQVLAIKDANDYQDFLVQYGIDRLDPSVWKFYDLSNADLIRREPLEAGWLDLSRYAIADAQKAAVR